MARFWRTGMDIPATSLNRAPDNRFCFRWCSSHSAGGRFLVNPKDGSLGL